MKRQPAATLALNLAVLLSCASCASPPPQASAPPSSSSSASAAASASAAPTSAAVSSATSAPPVRPKAGFVGFVNGAAWSSSPVGYSATLMDDPSASFGASLGLPNANRPRLISVDLTRPDDGERILVHFHLVPSFVGKHTYVCHGNECQPDFDGQLHRAKNAPSMLTTKEPSSLEVLKYEAIDAKTSRLSFWFDLSVEDVGAPRSRPKGKPVHAVGIVEDVEVLDIGEPVGLLSSGPTEMQMLPVDHLPARIRPKAH